MPIKSTKVRMGNRTAFVKAHIIARAEPSAQVPDKQHEGLPWLEPPFDPSSLAKTYENSSLLRPNISAYTTNIHSLGHRFEPVIDLNAPDAETLVADALFLDRVTEAEDAGTDPKLVQDPTPEEVKTRLEELKRAARVELSRLKLFFDYCCPGTTFTRFRREHSETQEVLGNSYWEVIRSKDGKPARFVLAPGVWMRATKQDGEYTPVDVEIAVSPFRTKKVEQHLLFRRYMQLDDMTAQPVVWFKEFGDPRVISRSTGEVYTDEVAMREKESNAKPATEILHFKIHSVRDSAYGIPRFAAAMPAVLGSRENEEVNLAYFENKSVPPLALLVNGGRLGKSAMTKLEDFFEENLKGKKNFHRILILEAEPSKGLGNGPSAVPKIAFERLRDQQQQDALFQVYDERNETKVGSQYRMPRILRGDDRNINRSTVFGSIRLAEDQVFEPERNDFDAVINVKLLSALGVRFWRFRSNAPVTRDPEILGAIVSDMVRFGILTPAEARELAKDIFSKDFATIDAQWMHQPLMLTLALVKNGMAPEAVLGASSTKDALAARAQEQAPAPTAGNGANGAVVPAPANAPKIQEGEA